jgi:hypothetical protein
MHEFYVHVRLSHISMTVLRTKAVYPSLRMRRRVSSAEISSVGAEMCIILISLGNEEYASVYNLHGMYIRILNGMYEYLSIK